MSSRNNIHKGAPGKPDLSILDSAKALAFVEQGNEDGSTKASTLNIPPLVSSQPAQAESYMPAARVAKVSVSLRLPQTMADKVMELAAEETLATRQRVTPHDIYVRAISGYLKSVPPKNTK